MGQFEFYDNNGNCWRCTPGSSCERCTSINEFPRAGPIDWTDQCFKPDCQELRSQGISLAILFPSTESKLFYQCRPDPANAGKWTMVERECPCDTLFSYKSQRCDFPHDWEPHCRNLNFPVRVETCPGELPPTEVPIDPTPPTEAPPTESTPSPCACIPWWPCWCNPCWHMPCGSCSGCVVG